MSLATILNESHDLSPILLFTLQLHSLIISMNHNILLHEILFNYKTMTKLLVDCYLGGGGGG